MGYALKIDTNGTRPDIIRSLVGEDLCDYIALDYKAPRTHYGIVTGTGARGIALFDKFSETLDFLIKSGLSFEVRTTIHAELITPEHINAIIDDLEARGYVNRVGSRDFCAGDSNDPWKSENLREVDVAPEISGRSYYLQEFFPAPETLGALSPPRIPFNFETIRKASFPVVIRRPHSLSSL